MKNKNMFLYMLFLVIFITGCSSKAPSSSGSGTKNDYKVYKTTVTKVSEDRYHNWLVTGTTKAPNGSKIIATPSDSSNLNYKMNAGESIRLASWAKVKNNKFKVRVEPVSLVDGDEKEGQKTDAELFAIENYNKPWTNAEINKDVISTAKKHFKSLTLTISSTQENYYEELGSSSSSSNSSSTSSSSSSSTISNDSSSSTVTDQESSSTENDSKKFENKINKLNKGTAEYATYDQATNTVTWIGFDAWDSYSNSDLQDMMDILQTITYRQAQNYNIDVPSIVVKTESGKPIAHAASGNDLKFSN